MPTILDQILSYKKQFVADAKRRRPLLSLEADISDLAPPRDFAAALGGSKGISVIAEIKKASPSKGILRADFDPVEIAKIYEGDGAKAISVLTDEKFFQGKLEYLSHVKAATLIPVMRKDFIIDEYQICESRARGADAILLIAALLSRSQLRDFLHMASELGMDCLVEVHSREDPKLVRQELEAVLSTDAEIIGINNRNLETFKTDLAATFNLMEMIPDDRIVVSESGISCREDVIRLQEAGVDAVLVGEALMKAGDIGKRLRELVGSRE